MSQLIELLDQLARAGVASLLLALAVTAGLVATVRNWRLSLPVMIIQYVVVGILLARVIEPSVALIKPLAGAIVCFALSIAAQRADVQRAQRGESVASDRLERPNWQRVPAQIMVRALAMILVLTATFGAAIRFPLPLPNTVASNARELGLGAYMLIGCSILIIATAGESLNAGLGILMLIAGFELAYTPLEPSISVSVLLGLVTLLVGLSIAYLTLADGGALHAGAEPVLATPMVDVPAEDEDELPDDEADAESDADEEGDVAEEESPEPNPAQANWLTREPDDQP